MGNMGKKMQNRQELRQKGHDWGQKEHVTRREKISFFERGGIPFSDQNTGPWYLARSSAVLFIVLDGGYGTNQKGNGAVLA
jgi:hypothetical protein